MRVRVVMIPDATSSFVKFSVQRWCAGQWEHVRNFALDEAVAADEFAMKLSMTKRTPVERVLFEDGEKLDIVDRLLRENAATNATLPDYEEVKP